jgi:structural maintenance of chromosome 1
VQDDAIIRHLVWKLYHIEQGIQANTEEIESKADHLRQLRKDHDKYDQANRQAKKELARAQKDLNKQDKAVRQRENDLEEAVSTQHSC